MKHQNRLLILAKALLLAALAATTQAQAQTWTWTKAAGGNFSGALNWDQKSAPVSSPDTELMFNLSGNYSVTNDISPGLMLFQLSFADSSGAVNMSGTELYFVMNSSGYGPEYDSESSNPITIANNVDITNSMTWYCVGDTTLGGALAMAPNVTLTKDYSGTMTLAQPQTFTNANVDFYIADGTLQTRSLNWNANGGEAYIGFGGVSGNTSEMVLSEGGDSRNRRCQFTQTANTTNIIGGVNTSGTVYYTDWLNAQNQSDTKNVYITAAPGGAVSILNIIAGANLSLTKIGGGTLIITSGGANSNPGDGLAFRGTTTIQAGTIQVNVDANGTGGNGYGGALGYNNNAVQLGSSLSLPTDAIALLTHGNNRLVTHPLSVNPYGASRTIGASDQMSSCMFSGDIQLFNSLTISAPDTNGVGVVTVSGNIADGSGANSVNIQGPGRVMFTGTDTYAGSTIVNSGTLQLSATAPATSCISNSTQVLIAPTAVLDVSSIPGFALASGQTLSGEGTVNGSLTVGSGATLAVGWGGSSTLGALNVSGGLTLAGNAVFRLDRANSPNSDQVFCTGAVAYGGTLTLNNVGAALQAGDTFTLFPAPPGGTSLGFANISPATPGSGLAWDFNQLGSGIVSVVPLTTKPTISPPLASQTVQCGQNVSYTVFATSTSPLSYHWSVNSSNITGATTTTYTINNIHNAGDTYTISVLVTNSAGSATSTATVKVIDTLAPVVTLLGANPLTVPALSPFADPGATALDQCAGAVAVTTNNTVNTGAAGSYTVTYSATDPSGNTGMATRTVIVTPATAVWANPVSGLWTTPANWVSNAAPIAPNSDAYVVNFASVALTNEVTVSLNSPETVAGLTFGDTGPSTPVGWLLGNDGNPANVLTFALRNGAPGITVSNLAGEAVIISAAIAGTDGLTVLADAYNALELTATNTYSGGTFLNGGTLIGNPASLPGNLTLSNTVNVVFDEGGASMVFTGLVYGAAGSSPTCYFTNGDITLTQGKAGTDFIPYIDDATLITRSTAQSTYLGYYSGSGTNSAFLLAQDGDIMTSRVYWGQYGVNTCGGANTNGTVHFNNWMNPQNNGSTVPVYFTAAAGGTVNFGNTIIGNNNFSWVKTGAGTVRLQSTGANPNDKAWTGGSTLRTGTLILAADADGTADPSGGGGSLGYNDLAVQLGDSLTQPSDTMALLTEGASRLVTHLLNVNAYGAGTTIGANDQGSPVFSGGVVLATNLQLLAQGAANVTFSGSISDGGTGQRLTKVGTGTVTLTAANTYSGATTVSEGTLDVQSDGGLGSGNVTVVDGATLILELGVANSYIGPAADLLLSGPAPVVNLKFKGTNPIHSLSFDGGATYAAAGTWGSPTSGAANTDSRFTGTGVLQVATATSPAPIPTQLTLVSAPNPSYSGTPVTFTATVSATGYVPSGGAVQFLTNGVASGAPVALAAGEAAVTLSLPVGTNTVAAQYPGYGDFKASSPASVKQVVTVAPAGYNKITRPVLTNGVYQSTFVGLADAQYALDTAASLTPPVTWTAVVTNQASASGVITFTFTRTGAEGYYRLRYVP
jgi:autotransporter-associated beta strand protein